MALVPFTIDEIREEETDPGQSAILPGEQDEPCLDLQPSDPLCPEPSAPPIDFEELANKKEYVVQAYQASFDREMAYKKCGVTDEEAKFLNQDQEFQDRLLYFLIEEREEILSDLRNLCKSEKEEVRLKATLARGKMFYASRFDEDSKIETPQTQKVDVVVHNTIELAIKKEDHAAEVLGILAENGVFQPGTSGLIDSKVESIHSPHTDTKTKRLSMA